MEKLLLINEYDAAERLIRAWFELDNMKECHTIYLAKMKCGDRSDTSYGIYFDRKAPASGRTIANEPFDFVAGYLEAVLTLLPHRVSITNGFPTDVIQFVDEEFQCREVEPMDEQTLGRMFDRVGFLTEYRGKIRNVE